MEVNSDRADDDCDVPNTVDVIHKDPTLDSSGADAVNMKPTLESVGSRTTTTKMRRYPRRNNLTNGSSNVRCVVL
jgi:hypothetical protein